MHLEYKGIKTVKYIPKGLPKPTFSYWSKIGQATDKVPDFTSLIGIAWPITFIGLIEGVSTARTISTKLKYDVNVNKEIVAFGIVNFTNAGFQVGETSPPPLFIERRRKKNFPHKFP